LRLETTPPYAGYPLIEKLPTVVGSALPDEDRALINRCLAGDQMAMVCLMGRYEDVVFGLCYRMLNHRQDAEDAAQETFARAFRSLERFDQERDFKPWVLTIAGNRCRTMLFARSRRPAPRMMADEVADSAPNQQAARNLAEEVELALAQLREEYRQAFVLFHEHELSYAEIGETLDCPIGTVKTWVHRARREMIRYLRSRGVVEEKGHEAG
jgi:RNA polymerase sigma-70 factor (ECF subfamily)